MKHLSEKLSDAIRIPIAVGQLVDVRSVDGARVATGWVRSVDPKSGVVRVKDDGSGADVEVDVDSTRYQLWVKPPPGAMAKLGATRTVYLRPGNTGIRTRNGFGV